MRRTSFSDMNCSIARTLEVVGEWWTMLIIREAFQGVRRFDDIQANLGIARNVLASRLQSLVDHGILERRLYQERPERYEYRLTPKGIDLYPVLISLMRWGDRWEAEEAGTPVLLVHDRCGQVTEAILACDKCGEPLNPRETHSEPGPGYGEGPRPARLLNAR